MKRNLFLLPFFITSYFFSSAFLFKQNIKIITCGESVEYYRNINEEREMEILNEYPWIFDYKSGQLYSYNQIKNTIKPVESEIIDGYEYIYKESYIRAGKLYVRQIDRDLVTNEKNGYEAIYLATSTVPGMSGGPIIGSRVCAQENPEYYTPNSWGGGWSDSGAYPGVIGLHGMSEEYSNSGGRSGTSLGIPLDLVVDFLGENADSYGVLVGRGYYDEVLKLCKQKLLR